MEIILPRDLNINMFCMEHNLQNEQYNIQHLAILYDLKTL